VHAGLEAADRKPHPLGRARLEVDGLAAAAERFGQDWFAIANNRQGRIGLLDLKLDGPLACDAAGGDLRLDRQLRSRGQQVSGERETFESKVPRPLGADIDHIEQHVFVLFKQFGQIAARRSLPRGLRKVGKDVNLFPGLRFLSDELDRGFEHFNERSRSAGGAKALDGFRRRRPIDSEGAAARTGIDDGDLALGRQLPDEPLGHLLGRLEPRLVLVAVLHPRRGID
jgi:hypothetical protein